MSIKHYPDASPAPIAKLFDNWRILWQATASGQYAALAELEFRQVIGVAEQATGGTPTASTNYDGNFNAPKAFDNNPGTGWNSLINNVNGAWLAYAFATPRTVRQLKLQVFNSAGGASYGPTSFKLQAYSGAEWNDVQSYTGLTWTAGETKLLTV